MDEKLIRYIEELETKLQHADQRLRELEVFIKGYNNNNGLLDRLNLMEQNIKGLSISFNTFEKIISDKLSMFSGVMKGLGSILVIIEFGRLIFPLISK